MCYENAMVCPICGEGKLYLSKSNGSIFPFTGKKCNKCDAIFLKKLDYMRILKEYGGIPLKDNVRIMNWHNDIHERNYVNEKKIKAENARTIDNSNLIHTLPYDDNMCPIHNKKMNIKTLILECILRTQCIIVIVVIKCILRKEEKKIWMLCLKVKDNFKV